jgi:hypothetical protein
MESILIPPELAILWRLVGRTAPGEYAGWLEAKFQIDRPRAHSLMIRTALMELKQDPSATPIAQEDLSVLLRSADEHVRLFAARLRGRLEPG